MADVTITLNDIKLTMASIEKIKIIALTGPYGVDLSRVQDALCRHHNIKPLQRVRAGGEKVSTEDFLVRIAKGDIIEASCEDNDEVWGTDVSLLFTGYVYVGIYTPEQIDNLTSNDRVEVLPLVIKMDAYSRMVYMLSHCKELHLSIREICEKYIYDDDHNDLFEYEDETWYSVYFPTYNDLDNWLDYDAIAYDLRKFNNQYNLISNLDNFLQ